MFDQKVTWRCDVCGRVRPDVMIGVAQHDFSGDVGLMPGTVFRNVKHCRDIRSCVEAAHERERWRIIKRGSEVSDA